MSIKAKNKMCVIPPIKCQGIKTKLVDFIKSATPNKYQTWYEPFMGSGAVGFNVQPKKAVFADTNPHLIRFYNDIKDGIIDYQKVRIYLTNANDLLQSGGESYYKEVRERFNNVPNSLDFLFLNRSCFNGMIRFNKKGEFNVPFCKKNNRFSKAYITKISNQVKYIQQLILTNEYQFVCDTFENIINRAGNNDIIYCDPPYIDRYSDYFNSWEEENEKKLFDELNKTNANFILSTWHHNKYRKNQYVDFLWNKFSVKTIDHFYHLGANESNRNAMVEALITNF